MNILEFFDCVHARISLYDLLHHPFYEAWSRGRLTREDLQLYAEQYYRQVESFPRCLLRLARRLPAGELRSAILGNLEEEMGGKQGEPHAELWLKFATGVGATVDSKRPLSREMRDLLFYFEGISTHGTPEEALTAFYVYESQVPRVSEEKLRGLKNIYKADDSTCEYFDLHKTADVAHAQVWKQQLENCLTVNPQATSDALVAAEVAARSLWNALTGIDRSCFHMATTTH